MIKSRYARVLLAVLSVIALVVVGGCKAEPSLAPQESKTIPADNEPAPEPEPETSKGPLTAEEIVAAFKDAGLPIGRVEIYDAANDPNEMLGRPGQYTAKFNFADTRLEQSGEDVRGGSIESFDNEEDRQNRADYIKSIGEDMPIFAEYQYMSGLMLLRLDKGLTPDQAAEYDAIFQTLGK